MITPTVGRIVHYYPAAWDTDMPRDGKPRAAIVTKVHGDRCVNLTVFATDGKTHGRSSTRLKQPDDAPGHPDNDWCEWMPYQQEKAKETPSAKLATAIEVADCK